MEKYLKFFRRASNDSDSTSETASILTDKKGQYAALLYSLAEGINPITGEEFGEGVMDQPDIIRALYAGASALSGKSSSKNKSSRNPNSGEKWTSDDDMVLLREYGNGASIRNLAKMFGRSELAIQMRLNKLNEKTEINADYKKSAMQNRKIR